LDKSINSNSETADEDPEIWPPTPKDCDTLELPSAARRNTLTGSKILDVVVGTLVPFVVFLLPKPFYVVQTNLTGPGMDVTSIMSNHPTPLLIFGIVLWPVFALFLHCNNPALALGIWIGTGLVGAVVAFIVVCMSSVIIG